MFELALAKSAVAQNNGPMKRLAWAVVASASLAVSCADSGQTGSAECPPVPLSCECDSLAGKSLVKATVLAIDTGSVTLELEQVLNPSPLLDESDVHRQVLGVLTQSLSCPRTAATYSREASSPRDVGEVVVAPWSDAIDPGNGRPLALSDAVSLTDPSTCESRYPRPSTPPCNDTNAGSCSLSAVHPPRSGALWWALFALTATLALRRNHKRPPPTQ